MQDVVPSKAVRAVVILGLLSSTLVTARICRGGDAVRPPVPADLVAAIKSLKTADLDGRQKVYDLLAEKGDARLIPALTAYKDGSLILRDDRLMIYGERENVEGKSVLPLIDAITRDKVIGPDGKAIYFPRPDLSKALRSPRPLEKRSVLDLIATLSLLDPDPIKRITSIRDAGNRASQAIPSSEDSQLLLSQLAKHSPALGARLAKAPNASEAPALREALALISTAGSEKSATLLSPAPSEKTVDRLKSALNKAKSSIDPSSDPATVAALADSVGDVTIYLNHLDSHKTVLDELPKTYAALKKQLEKEGTGQFAPALKEAMTSIDLVTTSDPAVRIASVQALGKLGTSRAANLLEKIVQAAARVNDKPLQSAAEDALSSANRYQAEVHVVQYTFAGLSAGSILVLLALGLSIIFGLMGVINMAQGEFMMVGAFTTLAVSRLFANHFSGAYNYYLLAAVPAAFLVAGSVGFIVEALVIRHLYGRPLETLLATWGVGYVLIWLVRWEFGNNVSIKPPAWMEGGWEVAPDIVFPLNRVFIILFCAACIAIVYFVINRTKLGLLLRATTQSREMALALGVPTRRVDGLTFAFGAGLAGLAGVAVPLYDNINPEMGQRYIVDCFMVVVVGGVGKLAGAIWAGLGLGFIGKYLEPILGAIPSLASGASVLGKVFVLGMIIVFLQWRPQGLFPPKGRLADA